MCANDIWCYPGQQRICPFSVFLVLCLPFAVFLQRLLLFVTAPTNAGFSLHSFPYTNLLPRAIAWASLGTEKRSKIKSLQRNCLCSFPEKWNTSISLPETKEPAWQRNDIAAVPCQGDTREPNAAPDCETLVWKARWLCPALCFLAGHCRERGAKQPLPSASGQQAECTAASLKLRFI